jgi:hypothetical protein
MLRRISRFLIHEAMGSEMTGDIGGLFLVHI